MIMRLIRVGALGLILEMAFGSAAAVYAGGDVFEPIRDQAAIAPAYNFHPLPPTAGKDITVAIICDGIDREMKGILGERVSAESVLQKDSDPFADAGGLNRVGSMAAGLVGALAPHARIISIKVLDKSGSGTFADIKNGINRATELKANIIILPVGASTEDAGVAAAIQNNLNKGGLVVASAGDESGGPLEFPARADNVVAVGATDSHDKIALYSSYGAKIIYAPGDITSLSLGKSKTGNGTSFSAGIAGAIFAVLWSQNPGLTRQQLVSVVLDNAAIIKDNNGGKTKRIDAQAALNAINVRGSGKAPASVPEKTEPVGGMHFNYDYQSGSFVRRMSGTVSDVQGFWNALLPLQPPQGAHGGYGLIGDDGLLGKKPGYGLSQLGRLARKFVSFESLYVDQPSGWESLGIQPGVFTKVEALNDTTLGWVFFDVRGKFENDMKQRLHRPP